MAARRGKSQARRNNGGNGGSIPAWAWAVLGALLAVVVILVAPKYLKSDGDGFFRPQPNPDAQPVPVAEDEDAVAPEGNPTSPKADAPKGDSAQDKDEGRSTTSTPCCRARKCRCPTPKSPPPSAPKPSAWPRSKSSRPRRPIRKRPP